MRLVCSNSLKGIDNTMQLIRRTKNPKTKIFNYQPLVNRLDIVVYCIKANEREAKRLRKLNI